MSYGDFRNPDPPRSQQDATRVAPKQFPKQLSRLEEFERLLAVNGSGNYHINHFVHAFEIEGSPADAVNGPQVAKQLTYIFSREFCDVFNEINIAKASFGEPKKRARFHGDRTVEFKIGGTDGGLNHRVIGAIHPDWVVMGEVPKKGATSTTGMDSFFGDTLKRLWMLDFEQQLHDLAEGTSTKIALRIISVLVKENPLSALLSEIIEEYGIDLFIETNQHHFLSGTRSWSVQYDRINNNYFVETVAVERHSTFLIDKFGSIPTDIRLDILMLWDNLLTNYVVMTRFDDKQLKSVQVKSLPGVYEAPDSQEEPDVNANIRHKTIEFTEAEFAKFGVSVKKREMKYEWARKALQRHPGLHKHLPKGVFG